MAVLRLAEVGALPQRAAGTWRRVAAELRSWIERRCWSPRRASFVAAADGEDLDAAVLQAARIGFLAGDDPRLRATVETLRRELGAGGPLLYRTSGLREREGAFVACSFWLVEALVAIGRSEEAEATFADTIALANDVGLLTEEVDPRDGAFLGNLPQALSHLSLISAAEALSP